jgi:hypothetical protein
LELAFACAVPMPEDRIVDDTAAATDEEDGIRVLLMLVAADAIAVDVAIEVA